MRPLSLPVGQPDRLEAGDRARRRGHVELVEGERVDALDRADPCLRGGVVGPRRGQSRLGRAEQDPLLAVTHEPGLHQQFDIAIDIGARDVEPRRAALGALPQDLLDQPVPDVARIGHPDRIELHDRPLVADRFTLDADKTGDAALALVHVHEVVRAERAEWQAEQAEDADRRAADRQAERPRGGVVRLAQP